MSVTKELEIARHKAKSVEEVNHLLSLTYYTI